MNASPTLWTLTRRTLRNLGIGLAAVWLFGMAMPSHAAVPVDQQPLVVQIPVPPNIVLMQDDSGSMGSDYMPDWGYIKDNTTDASLRYSGHNFTYYNPNVLYTPPPHADGTYYPESPSLGGAFKDGFMDRTSADLVDITQYYGSYPYFESLTSTQATNYDPVPGCATGDTLLSNGECQHVESTSYSYYPLPKSQQCNAGDHEVLRNNKYVCVHVTYTYSYYDPDVPSCPYGGTFNGSENKCIQNSNLTVNLFAYTTLDSSGNYVHNFVGKNQSDCAVATSLGYNCDYSALTQQSVANWFSYYRTRMLMTKSGIMSSFISLPKQFRVGFGSINGRNNGELPANTVTYNSKTFASVQTFGDGTAGTQKAAMWYWLNNLTAGSGTPLRVSLDAVGKYYESAQPWQTSASDTSELACRQSYTILTTDGLWNSTDPGVGNVDGTDGSKITGINSQTYTYKAAAPYADAQSDTLADVAMKYWVNDLRTSVNNEVPTSNADPAFWQHMTTFTLSIGMNPQGITPSTATVDDIFKWADGGTPISGFSWPVPSASNGGSINNIADLAHAAVNGHGGYYAANSPQAFTIGLQGALKKAAERVGTGSSLAANSTQLKTGTVAYQANYYTATWKGDLKAFAIDPNTGAFSVNPIWRAANQMPNWSLRNIYTYNPTGGTPTTQFVPFKSISSLSSAELSALGSNSTDQQNVLNYLRGDQSMEQDKTNGIYRVRTDLLGDIVNSQPVYVGAPNANQFYGENFTGSSTYQAFATAQMSREALVYVAANDGMLHAFDAATGVEKFAYVPAAVIKSGLAQLSDPNYGSIYLPHVYFNDGQLTVADVYMNGAWRTVLVGTTGRGPAKAIYALDITDPSSIQFLWERSAGDGLSNSDYIGQMTGKPVIAQVSDGSWSVLMGNGYNSTNGQAALLQFDLATGALDVHLTGDASTSNGLAAPALWMNDATTGISSVAYAGDLDGNVWSFQLQNASGSKATPTSTGTLLFTALGPDGVTRQPITGGMLVGQNPNTSDRWLFFGTGRYLSQNDLLDTSVQSWYGIIVDSTDSTLVSNLLSLPYRGSLATTATSPLVQRYIIAQTALDTSTNPPTLPQRVITPMPTPSDMTGKSGWFIDLQTPVVSGTSTTYLSEGERMVTPNQFQGNVLLGTTRIPQAKDICNPTGSGWIMAVDPWTGTNPVKEFFDANGDGQLNSGDSVTVNGKTYAAAGLGFSSLPNNPIFVGGAMLVSFDNGTKGSVLTSGSTANPGRVSWRELTTQ